MPCNNYPSIPLEALPLRPSTLKVFHQRGFFTTLELDESRRRMANLAAELNLPLKQVAALLKEVDKCLEVEVLPLPTASQILHNNNASNPTHCESSSTQHRNIVTFSRQIDRLLGGGIALGQVTEIAGMPGTGKTQLATQLCVDARLPSHFGGVQGQALYVDSEGSFAPERAYQMAKELVKHVNGSAAKKGQPIPDWTPEQILDGIHLFRVHDETAQRATLESLPHYIQQHNQSSSSSSSFLPIKLIVLDSIAFHYRAINNAGSDHNQNYYLQRTQALAHLAALLGDMAQTYNVAVVVINQMTTKLFHNNQTKRLVPALGESWAHATTTRILLSDDNNITSSSSSSFAIKTCTLVKSPHLPQGKVHFQIRSNGIRDPTNTVTPTKAAAPPRPDQENDQGQPNIHRAPTHKRLRT